MPRACYLADYRSGLTRKEADLRELSDRLAHAQQLLATQHQLLGSPTAASGPYTSHGPAAAAGRTSDGASPSGGGHVALDTSALAAAGQGPGHGQQTHGASPAGSGVKGGAQGRGPRSPGPRGAGGRGGEAASDDDVVLVMPGGALTEADWKLVMLTGGSGGGCLVAWPCALAPMGSDGTPNLLHGLPSRTRTWKRASAFRCGLHTPLCF